MIEVMIAVLLTAIATSGIIGLYVVQSRASGFARHQTEGMVLAQDKLERLRTVPDTTGGSDPLPLNANGLTTGNNLIYSRSWTIVDATPLPYYDIVVTVQWDEDGQLKDVTLRGRRNKS